MKWFTVHLNKHVKKRCSNKKDFDCLIDLLGDGVSKIWVALE